VNQTIFIRRQNSLKNKTITTSIVVRRHRAPGFQSLEDCKLMTVNVSLAANGLPSILTDNAADNVRVYQANGQTRVDVTNGTAASAIFQNQCKAIGHSHSRWKRSIVGSGRYG